MKVSAGKRVLMLIENGSFLMDSRVRPEAKALIHAGYKVSVICQADSKWVWKENIENVTVYTYPAPLPGKGFLGYLFEYGYSLAATFLLSLIVCLIDGFDIIHAANPPDTALIVAAFYKLVGVRFVFDHHDLAPEMYWERFSGRGNRLVYKILLTMERYSCRLADIIIATNESYKSIEMERHAIPQERIAIVRNGPLLEKFRLSTPDPVLRAKAKVILAYVGVMAPQDGVDYLLRALHLLRCELKKDDFYCVIIGKGSTLDDLKELAKKLDLEKHVWFTGYIPDADMLRYLSTADICIDPDPSNPFNDRCTMIKMMEYMAMGKPIVAFDLPEHRVTAQNGALYARPNDELEFARQIAVLMDDPERRERMGKEGRKRIESELAWSYQAENLLEAYKALSSSSKWPKPIWRRT